MDNQPKLLKLRITDFLKETFATEIALAHIIALAFFALLGFAIPAYSADLGNLAYQPTPLTTSTQSENVSKVFTRRSRPTLAIALGGGGVRGAAHIGVLRVLERENIPIDFIFGNSMGAIVGGMYAAGVPLNDLQQMFEDKSVFKAYTPIPDTMKLLGVPASMLLRSAKVAIGLPTNLVGLHSENRIAQFVNQHVLPVHRDIENSITPFAAVATNLLDGQAHTICSGNLGRALQASSAIPFYIKPVWIDGKLLVDGALRSNVPILQARQSRADIVLAVNVDETLAQVSESTMRRVTPFGNRILNIVLEEIDGHQSEFADIEIRPALNKMPLYSRSINDAKRAIEAGEQATIEALPRIKELLHSKLATEKAPEQAMFQQFSLQ